MAQGFGYPATKREVLCFGHLARRVKRLSPPTPLSQSFAEIVKGEMAWRDQEQRSWKRCLEDWMDQDDLLGEDALCEQELRARLLHGSSGESSYRQNQGGNTYPRGAYGGWDHGGDGRGCDYKPPDGNQQGGMVLLGGRLWEEI